MTWDTVQKVTTCPEFEAAFLHVEICDDLADLNKLETDIKNLKPYDSIFGNLPVLTGSAYQYVNLPVTDFKNKKDNELLRDTTPGSTDKFHADRMGCKPRVLVRFNTAKKIKFKLTLVGDRSNLEYYDDEKNRNSRFEDHLAGDYETNELGYCVITDLSLSAAGGNKYTIKVNVTHKGYSGTRDKSFAKKGELTTARYLWMLPVQGGKGRWNPTISYADCMKDTIEMYRKDAFIHINNTRLTLQHVSDHECMDSDKLGNWRNFSKRVVRYFLENTPCNDGKMCPVAMWDYTFLALRSRFGYEKEKATVESGIGHASSSIRLTGGTRPLLLSGNNDYLIPHNGVDKAFLISAKGRYIGPAGPEFDISSRIKAEWGYQDITHYSQGGHIGCSRFEFDTTGLTIGADMTIKIEYWKLKFGGVRAGGNSVNMGTRQSSGFCVFTAEDFKSLTPGDWTLIPLPVTTCIVSHELGHAMGMVSDGLVQRPNASSEYYDNDYPVSYGKQYMETENHSGPHCHRGLINPTPISASGSTIAPGTTVAPGTCLMFGAAIATNTTFCNTAGTPARAPLVAKKENDCTMAIRKVDLYKPWRTPTTLTKLKPLKAELPGPTQQPILTPKTGK